MALIQPWRLKSLTWFVRPGDDPWWYAYPFGGFVSRDGLWRLMGCDVREFTFVETVHPA